VKRKHIPEVGPDAALGRRVSVHWNLHFDAYSVKVAGKPVFMVPQLTLRDCVTVVVPRLRAAFEAKPSRRTVHALIRGTLVGYNADSFGGDALHCNPFQWIGFVDSSERVVASADLIVFHPDKKMEARGLTLA
jgi:hypothetical protein